MTSWHNRANTQNQRRRDAYLSSRSPGSGSGDEVCRLQLHLVSPQASRCRMAYILPLWFFFISSFFSTPNLWGHWTDLNQILTHIHWWLLFEKFGLNSPRASDCAHGLGQKNAFLDRFWTFTVKYLCNGRWYQQPETNLSIYMDSLNAPKFGELWSRHGWKRLASFCLWYSHICAESGN